MTAALVALLGCSSSPRTERELEAEFKAFVADKQACMVDADCVIASTSCPLGCFAAVNGKFKDTVEAKSRELVSEYESGGRSCDYECVAPDLRCEASRCEAGPRP